MKRLLYAQAKWFVGQTHTSSSDHLKLLHEPNKFIDIGNECFFLRKNAKNNELDWSLHLLNTDMY